MQGNAEEPPLVSSPRRREHSLCEVKEGAVNPGAIGQINPDITQLLRHKEAVASIICMDHGNRVAETIGDFLQTQLQTTFRVLLHQAQVSIQFWRN